MSRFNPSFVKQIPRIITTILKVIEEGGLYAGSYLVGTYIDPTNGNAYTTGFTTHYWATNHISCIGVTRVVLDGGVHNTQMQYAFYTATNAYISGGTVTLASGRYKKTVTPPANATQIRITFSTENFDYTENSVTFESDTSAETELTITNLDALRIANENEDYAIGNYSGKVIVNFGDSIFGKHQDGDNSVSDNIRSVTGATVHNLGFGGCWMSQHNNADYDKFSMYQIATAIASGNFSAQTTAAAKSGMPTYFPTTAALLASINWTNVDIITIGYGTNDYAESVVMNDTGNPKNVARFKGALRQSIETILGTYPNIKIIPMSTTYRFFMDASWVFTDDSNTYTNTNGDTLLTFNAAVKAVAEEYNLSFIDNYNIGIGKLTRTRYFGLYDGTHHASRGRTLLGQHIGRQIMSLY